MKPDNPAPFPPIATLRLILRCVEARDAAATAAMMTPAVARRLARWPFPCTTAMAAARIEASRAAAAAGHELPFAIIDRSTSTLLGWIVIHRDTDRPTQGSFGYWLGEAHHGQGTMREAAPAALEYGMKHLGLDIIEAGAHPDHAASFAIMRACRMIPIGERMVPAPARGRDELCLIYALHRAPHPGNAAFAAPGTKG
jgi:ribosomal-protein-alanine N-acetyltransferase